MLNVETSETGRQRIGPSFEEGRTRRSSDATLPSLGASGEVSHVAVFPQRLTSPAAPCKGSVTSAYMAQPPLLEEAVSKLIEPALSRARRLKPTPTSFSYHVGAGCSRRGRGAADSSFETASRRRGQCVACRFSLVSTLSNSPSRWLRECRRSSAETIQTHPLPTPLTLLEDLSSKSTSVGYSEAPAVP